MPPGGPSLTRGWPSLEPCVSGHTSNLCPKALPDMPAAPLSPSVERKHRQRGLHSSGASGFLNIQLPGQRWGEVRGTGGDRGIYLFKQFCMSFPFSAEIKHHWPRAPTTDSRHLISDLHWLS